MKTKIILLGFCFAILPMSVFLTPVDSLRAKDNVKQFVLHSQFGRKMPGRILDSRYDIVYTHYTKNGRPAVYVINVGDSAFAIVSADDVAHPVLGYSNSQSWSEMEEEIPQQLLSYFDEYATQIESVSYYDESGKIASEWKRIHNIVPHDLDSLPRNVEPMLTTSWAQGNLYNRMCPKQGGSSTMAGCVAVAMAQIIKFWAYPKQGRGIHSYESNVSHVVCYDTIMLRQL